MTLGWVFTKLADCRLHQVNSALPNKRIRVVFGHLGWSGEAIEWHRAIALRAQHLGWDVVPFCLVPDPPAPRMSFPDLDRRWKRRDRTLVQMRDRLDAVLSDADVFWNFNGANVHPEWLQGLDTLNVYSCFDDPESTDDLSRPTAVAYDAALVGNLACLPLYRGWGIERVEWAPLAFVGDDFDPGLTPERVLVEDRQIDLIFFGERDSPYRRERLDRLAREFPSATFHGRGWPGGYASVAERRAMYSRAKIGWNIHNSVGPVNLRLFALPAAGVLQICDNRNRLGQAFDLGREVIGFDAIDECIELTHYYLKNDDERRHIAAEGLRRYIRDYSEPRLWEYFFGLFSEWIDERQRLRDGARDRVRTARPNVRLLHRIGRAANRALRPVGLELRRAATAPHPVNSAAVTAVQPLPYTERPEAGPVNWAEKVKRVEQGGEFEWPNIVALNWAVASLVGSDKRIVELGCGTGSFAYEAAADPSRTVLASDLDADAVQWAQENRQRPNIRYVSRLIGENEGPFDLAVAIEVIEHLESFEVFLRTCSRLAPRLLVTTPNRSRLPVLDAGPPSYYQHVREWTAGELYWVLRCFYRDVQLFTMPDPYIPAIEPILVTDRRSPVIADCRRPVFSGAVNQVDGAG